MHQFRDFGHICRIDFTDVNKKPGFTEKVNGLFKSVFIHFDAIHVTAQSIVRVLNSGQSHTFYPSCINEFWILLKVKKPIQDTFMNNSQIVENCRYLEKIVEEHSRQLEAQSFVLAEQSQKLEEQSQKLEEQSQKLEEQSQKLEEQSQKLEEQSQKLEAVTGVVYQLLGGLFNQRSQAGIIGEHLHRLFPDLEVRSEFTNGSCIGGTWPTTRQGDELECRVTHLEAVISDMSSIPDLESTESESLPDLELGSGTILLSDLNSESDTDSLPDLILG
jgi:hypothetical protein